MSAASCLAVPCTLWQRPTVLIRVARLSAQQFIAIGLTYCSERTSGQSRSMSRAESSSTGIVRRARMMPPMPSVSAMVWRRPNFFGISKSMTVHGLVAADLDHGDDVVGAVERLLAVARRLDLRRGAERRLDAVGDLLRDAQPLRVDVEERDARPGERRIGEDVAEQVLGEDRAAGADEGDLGRRHELPSGPGRRSRRPPCLARRPPGSGVAST